MKIGKNVRERPFDFNVPEGREKGGRTLVITDGGHIRELETHSASKKIEVVCSALLYSVVRLYIAA